MHKRRSLTLVFGLALAAAAAAPEASAKEGPKIESRADQHLRRMSEHLAGLKSFRVRVQAADEVVMESGQKVQLLSESQVSVKRPNKLRSERVGPVAELVFQYDGKQLSIIGKQMKYYAVAPAPGTIDKMIDVAREQYGLEAPGADLLFSDTYEILTEDVIEGTYVGLEPIRGVTAHHLAFRGREVDWQIWIQDGSQPLPLRYVITSKKEEGQPEFVAELSSWQPKAELSDDQFTLSPPKGAKRIDFLGRRPRSGAAPAGAPRAVLAVVGRPATPGSYAGVARRTSRRTVRRTAYYSGASSGTVNTLPAGCVAGVSCGGAVYEPAYDGGNVVYVAQ